MLLHTQEGLAFLGLSRRRLASLVSTTFSTMIFDHGFVHCDPHPGNLLARPMPRRYSSLVPSPPSWGRHARAQLVVLDHGMYRTLNPSFRQARGSGAVLGRSCRKGAARERDALLVPSFLPPRRSSLLARTHCLEAWRVQSWRASRQTRVASPF